MKKRDTPLSASLRKYIREKKAEIRRQYGPNSTEEEEFFEWIAKKRAEKHERIQGEKSE